MLVSTSAKPLKFTNSKFVILGGAIGVILAGVGLYQVLGSQVLQSKPAAHEQPIALSEIKTVILYWNEVPLPVMVSQVAELEARVAAHLAKMGFEL
jgi:hypothetical protein